MKKRIRRRLWVIMAVLVVSLIVVMPSILTKSGQALERVKIGKFKLSGTATYLKQKGEQFSATYRYHLGLDLQGGTHLVYEIDTSKIDAGSRAAAVDSLANVIETRVNQFGVSEPVIYTTKRSGADFLVVELAGIKDVNHAIDLIGKTAELEFKVEGQPVELPPEIPQPQQGPNQQFVSNKPPLKGNHLKKASQIADPTTGQPVVQIEFDEEGSKIFADMTKASLNKSIAINLDGEIISAPIVNAEINGGVATISGSFTAQSAKELAIQLNAGALPVPIKVAENRTVGASLGTESINKSLFAGLVGIMTVMLFMIIYYRLLGVLASISLALYALISLALFRGMLSFILPFTPVTLTLAGIAGFILSIGIAVDANILIFERLKEELRDGKSFETAVSNGFARAWTSIKDSNISSMITTIILFAFGTGIIRGFAVTLGLGIVVSLFSAITVTRTLLNIVTRTKWGKASWLYGFKFEEKAQP